MPRPETIESLRPLLLSIAYRMLGTVSDAEDVVQEALLRYHRAVEEGAQVLSLKAYLSAVVTRLSIDQLRSARERREEYVGEWIPEPLLTDHAVADPLAVAETGDSISMAFLLLLERLSPVERAVFLLHDVFGYEFAEVAEIVGKSEANTRQLAHRARRHIEAGKPRFDASRETRDALADRFFAAVAEGDMDHLVEMLAADVVVHGDSGGKAPRWAGPIAGARRVAPLLVGTGRQMAEHGAWFERHLINGQPGAIVRAPTREIVSVFVLDIQDGAVQTIRSVINPDKLRHLGPVADVYGLLRGHRGPAPTG